MKQRYVLSLLLVVVVGSFAVAYLRRAPSLLQPDGTIAAKKLIDSANGDQQKLGDASDILSHVIANDPDNQYAYFLQARALQQRGLIDQAIESYQRYIDLNFSSDFATHYNSGELYEVKGDTANAERFYQVCLDLAPTVPAAWERMIMLQLKVNNGAKAKVYFDALKLALPNHELIRKLTPLVPQ